MFGRKGKKKDLDEFSKALRGEFDPKVIALVVLIKQKESETKPPRPLVAANVEEVIRMLFKDSKWVDSIRVMLKIP